MCMEHKNTNNSLKKAISENRKFLNEQINQDRMYSIDEAKVIMRNLIKKLYDSIK